MRIYDWVYDYERRDEVFLVIGGEQQDQRIPMKRLDHLAVNMLENQQQDLIHPVVESLDHGVRLFYPITGLRMLADEMKLQSWNMERIVQCLLELISKLERGRELLLLEQHFVLKSDWIFVRDSFQDLQLIYLPVHELEKAPPLREQLRNLVEGWSNDVEQCTMEQWRQLLAQFSEHDFSLDKLKTWCLDQCTSRLKTDMINQEDSRTSRDHQENCTLSSPNNKREDPDLSSSELMEQSKVDTEKDDARSYMQELIPLEEAATQALLPKKRRDSRLKKSLVIGSFIVLVMIMLISFFVPFPGGETVLIGSILFMIVGISCMIWWDRRNEQQHQSELEVEEEDFEPWSNFAASKAPSEDQASQLISMPDSNKVNHIPATTILPLEEEQTVLLSPSSIETDTKESSYILEQIYPESAKKILKLDHPHFRIGRDTQSADYVSEQVGVSRLHCELVLEENANRSHTLRDLGSRNGTYLNDELLVPFKTYPLKSGDCIRILNETFEYRVE